MRFYLELSPKLMLPEIGHFALILALCFACLQAALPLYGAYRQQPLLLATRKPLVFGQLGFLLLSFCTLLYAFITNDFSVAYVAENSNSHLPLLYRIAAVWGAHEGSLLLWVTMLGLWSTAAALFSRTLDETTQAQILSVLGMISIGFLLFLLTTSSPFKRLLLNTPLDGRDLNPLLQDFGLAIHPPILYMGYVGFAVAFAFAIAALMSGQLDRGWAKWSRPWTLAAWCFLTVGITLGSWWAYRELGWGGWWFWDPVENASFLPWLVGTALFHSLIVSEKRDTFKSWTVLLALCAFSLSLMGTFLVRSGILTSVHAFASDPARGVFMLKFLFIVVGGSLLLYGWQAPKIYASGRFELLSRETMLLSNNIILMVCMATVLLGTLYPLMLDATGLGKISVGAPYFNAVFVPLFGLLLIFMGIGPHCKWQEMSAKELLTPLRYTLLGSLILAIALPFLLAQRISFAASAGLFLGLWVMGSTLQDGYRRIRIQGLRSLPRHYAGMLAAHLGVAICVIGVSLTATYSIERDLRIRIGDTAAVGPYQFTFDSLADLRGANYTGVTAIFNVTRNKHFIARLAAEKRLYNVQQTVMTEAAIDAGLWRDLYIALGEPLGNGAWAARIYYKPLVRWIWLGGLLMALGGILAASDKRYRKNK